MSRYRVSVQLRYNFRIEPTPGQIRSLAKTFGCARVVYNDALRLRKDARTAGLPYPTTCELAKALITEAKCTPERAWLSEVSPVVLQQSLRDLDAAYKNLFESVSGKRKGRKVCEPQFKSRKDGRQAVRFSRAARFKVTPSGNLLLPKVGEVAVRWSRTLPSAPSSVTVVKDASGRHFASFVVQTDPAADAERFPAGDAYTETGIDLGLTHFAVRDNGEKVGAPRFLRKAERRLKKLQQSLARKQKGSANREKARIKLARQHARVADARRDFHHKLSTTLIRENQAVYVEDLAVAGLGRTRLAKSVHDAGWSQFVNMLEYKAARYGRTFAKVDRWAPTSQVCSACGVKDGPKPLDVREWTCGACGAHHDRDINAARNILTLGKLQVAAGRAETENACGAQVRPGLVPAPRSEAGTRLGDFARATPARSAVGISGFQFRKDVNVSGMGSNTGTHKREQIAADLRTAILDGRYAPGAPLPSASELCTAYDTSRVTVRRALELLHAAGLIDMRQGAVARVRTTPAVRIAIVAADWRRHREAQRPGFDATVAEHGHIGRQEVLAVEDPAAAPGHIAAELGLPDGEPAVMRYVRMFADDTPVRLARLWFRSSWASGTALADRRRIRGGVAALVEQLQAPLVFSDVDLEGRGPSNEERDLLDLARGVTVVHTITTFRDRHDLPVYVQEEIADASRHRWRFRVTL